MTTGSVARSRSLATRYTSQGGTVEPTDVQERIEPAEAADRESAEPTPLVEDELLVEEISIDGMCGVY